MNIAAVFKGGVALSTIYIDALQLINDFTFKCLKQKKKLIISYSKLNSELYCFGTVVERLNVTLFNHVC